MVVKAILVGDTVKIRKVGAALGIILPRAVLTNGGWGLDTKLLFEFDGDKVIFFEKKSRKTAADPDPTPAKLFRRNKKQQEEV